MRDALRGTIKLVVIGAIVVFSAKLLNDLTKR